MFRLRFSFTLCLSISLILGQLSCVKCTYASSFLDQDIKVRQRKGANTSLIPKDSERDVEKADRQLLQAQFREENKKKFDQSIRYGMAGLTLLASYMVLWNMAHTPQTFSATRPYERDDFKRIYNQQYSFTNSSAFSTLQFFIIGAAFITMIKSIYTLWQVKDTLPSAKEIKFKGKSVSLDTSMTVLQGAAVLLRIIPETCNKVKTVIHKGPEEAIFRPSKGSTNPKDLSGWSQAREDILHLFRLREMPLISHLFKLEPATEELKKFKTHPPKAFEAQYVIFDASSLYFNHKDLAFLLSLKKFYEIRLRDSHLGDQQLNLIKNFSSSLEILDIRQNPSISLASLLDNVVWAVAPQNLRGIMGFGKVRKVLFDAREDAICETGLLLHLVFPARRKIRVSGELTRKDELGNLFDRKFHYFNQATPSSPLPHGLSEIIGHSPKRSLPDSYIEKGYRNGPEINYERLDKPLNTIRDVTNYILGVGSKDIFYLIEYDENNKPVLYRSPAQQLKRVEDMSASSSETRLISSKTRDYRVTSDRIFGKLRKNSKTLEEGIQYLEEDVLSANSRGAYLIEYDSDGNHIFYGAHSIFQYHDQNDIWFTPSTIYLPNTFKDRYDLRLYLRERHKIYKASNPDNLMAGEIKEITSFIKIDLKDGFIVLADELKHLDKHHVTVRKLEELGLLTEVRLIETLTECGFLSSLQLEVKDNSWH